MIARMSLVANTRASLSIRIRSRTKNPWRILHNWVWNFVFSLWVQTPDFIHKSPVPWDSGSEIGWLTVRSKRMSHKISSESWFNRRSSQEVSPFFYFSCFSKTLSRHMNRFNRRLRWIHQEDHEIVATRLQWDTSCWNWTSYTWANLGTTIKAT